MGNKKLSVLPYLDGLGKSINHSYGLFKSDFFSSFHNVKHISNPIKTEDFSFYKKILLQFIES